MTQNVFLSFEKLIITNNVKINIMIRRTYWIVLIIFSLILVTETNELLCDYIHETGDASELIINIGKKRQNGSYISDINCAKIEWKRSQNETENLEKFRKVIDYYNINQLVLNVKTKEKWKSYKYDREVVHFSNEGSFRWNSVPRIPCLKQKYQVVIPPNTNENSTECFGTKIVTLPAESPSVIRAANYNPEPPTSLVVDSSANAVNIGWNATECSEEYVVLLYEYKLDWSLMYNVSVDANEGYQSTQISYLNSCSEYHVEVFSKLIGNTIVSKQSSYKEFYTDPELDALDHLEKLDIVSHMNSTTLTFPTYQEKVKCLQNYELSFCDKNYNCTKPMAFQKTNSNGVDFVNFTVTKILEDSSIYYIKIESKYYGYSLNPRYISIQTGVGEVIGTNTTVSKELEIGTCK